MKQVEGILMPGNDYVTMPQNDMAQIEQVSMESYYIPHELAGQAQKI